MNNKGISTIVTIIAIFVLGILFGGLFYFIGSQASQTTYSSQPSEAAPTSLEDSGFTQELLEIDKELKNADLDSIDTDLKDIDKDASQI